ncbi:hypothetical protein ElP_73260 (plasmid) [Tautonia plasticadhaerens]|uniref:Uncharacterized protein n=1 Tax=Tautonia plasticadhaerens TaxID=2527974 RepID=A0A518HET8_9BACT|nr:hypothetical protein ElP_73260 [Tautonia plasticadhaerens]
MTNLGHPAYPRPKGTGDHNMPEKRGQATSASRTPREARVVGPRLDCLKSNPDRDTGSPAATLTQRGVTACRVTYNKYCAEMQEIRRAGPEGSTRSHRQGRRAASLAGGRT